MIADDVEHAPQGTQSDIGDRKNHQLAISGGTEQGCEAIHRNASATGHVSARSMARLQQCDVQGGEVADVYHDPGGAAPGHTAHLDRCLDALGCLTELITRGWSQ